MEIYKCSHSCAECEMDFSTIKTIADLLKFLGIPLCDLLLPCIVCEGFLNQEDIENFTKAPFLLVWRQSCAHGICKRCSRLSATFERNYCYERRVSADDFIVEYGDSVFAVPVRCLFCYHVLSDAEKDSMIESQRPFHWVRSRLRGYCQPCADERDDR